MIIQVEDHDIGGVPRIIDCKKVTQVHRNLGCNLNLFKSNAEAVEVLITKTKHFNTPS